MPPFVLYMQTHFTARRVNLGFREAVSDLWMTPDECRYLARELMQRAGDIDAQDAPEHPRKTMVNPVNHSRRF